MSESEAFRRIIEIVKDQKKLEDHQFKTLPFESVQQSRAFAFKRIFKLLEPLLIEVPDA